jgi:hypothetical protein
LCTHFEDVLAKEDVHAAAELVQLPAQQIHDLSELDGQFLLEHLGEVADFCLAGLELPVDDVQDVTLRRQSHHPLLVLAQDGATDTIDAANIVAIVGRRLQALRT